MSRVKKNIAANFVGSLWTTLMSLAFIPFYIRFMGMEAYGLVGFYIMLLSILTILDLGMTATSQRQVALLAALPDKGEQLGGFIRTIEPAFWLLGLMAGLVTTALASLIVHHWLRISHLTPATAQRAVILMGWAMACRAPLNLYVGGLQGLERQVTVNILSGASATLQGCGSVLLLWLISPSIVVFFAWQVLLGLLQLVGAAILLRRALPAPAIRTQSRREILRGVWRFALGTNADTLVSFAAGQMDKIVLTKVLPLQMYGYYALASTVASCLFRIAGPIQAAIYPRYTNLVATKDEGSLRALYHESSQLISALVVPAAVVLGVFAQEVIFVWTHSRDTASQVAPILRFLAFGTGLAALFSAPNVLLLANGWVSLLLYSHVGALLFAAAAVVSLTRLFGAVGAALAWLLLNAGFILIVCTIMHRRLLRGDALRWMRQSVAIPLLASLAVVGPARLLAPTNLGAPAALVIVLAVSILSLVCTGFATPATRKRAMRYLRVW